MNHASKLALSFAAALALTVGAASAECMHSKQVLASAPETPATPVDVALLKKKLTTAQDEAKTTDAPETTGSVVAQ